MSLLFYLWCHSFQGQDSKKNRVKLTGEQIKQINAEYAVYAGVNKANGCAWLLISYEGGTRFTYWHWRSGQSGSSQGTFRTVGDKGCKKAEFSPDEQSSETYEIGEDKFELWLEGPADKFNFAGTYYRLRQAGRNQWESFGFTLTIYNFMDLKMFLKLLGTLNVI